MARKKKAPIRNARRQGQSLRSPLKTLSPQRCIRSDSPASADRHWPEEDSRTDPCPRPAKKPKLVHSFNSTAEPVILVAEDEDGQAWTIARLSAVDATDCNGPFGVDLALRWDRDASEGQTASAGSEAKSSDVKVTTLSNRTTGQSHQLRDIYCPLAAYN